MWPRGSPWNPFHRQDLPNVSETEWYSTGQIRQFQEARLQKMVRYAAREIPYYHKIFRDSGINPRSIKTIDDLPLLPVLNRGIIHENYSSLVNPSVVQNTHMSGGSTGERLKWAYSVQWSRVFNATLFRGFRWAGLTQEKRVFSVYNNIIGRIFTHHLVIAGTPDNENLPGTIAKIREFEPDFGYCYASIAYILARVLLSRGETIPLEGFVVTSDPLYPKFRTAISEAFECPVYDNYGCNDGGAWGAECDHHTGFHHDFERSIIEFVGGKMIVTDLFNNAMPFIRYENGDTGRWIPEPCPCGRSMPLFSIEGRVNDYLVTPSRVISPKVVSEMLKYEGLADIRVVQSSPSTLTIRYTRMPGFTPGACVQGMKPFLSLVEDMDVSIQEEDSLETTVSGKQRIVVNVSGGSF